MSAIEELRFPNRLAKKLRKPEIHKSSVSCVIVATIKEEDPEGGWTVRSSLLQTWPSSCCTSSCSWRWRWWPWHLPTRRLRRTLIRIVAAVATTHVAVTARMAVTTRMAVTVLTTASGLPPSGVAVSSLMAVTALTLS
ncbi:hypothetical protein R5R35_004304 [Gryllus longicercus]|uniref:Uncharacterized protein n=1 Tax=Gryllus longicercus TaxID=2509291 RepID=A0AAN9VM81_9ORTH